MSLLRASSSVRNTSKEPALCFYLFSVFATLHEALTLVFDIIITYCFLRLLPAGGDLNSPNMVSSCRFIISLPLTSFQ